MDTPEITPNEQWLAFARVALRTAEENGLDRFQLPASTGDGWRTWTPLGLRAFLDARADTEPAPLADAAEHHPFQGELTLCTRPLGTADGPQCGNQRTAPIHQEPEGAGKAALVREMIAGHLAAGGTVQVFDPKGGSELAALRQDVTTSVDRDEMRRRLASILDGTALTEQAEVIDALTDTAMRATADRERLGMMAVAAVEAGRIEAARHADASARARSMAYGGGLPPGMHLLSVAFNALPGLPRVLRDVADERLRAEEKFPGQHLPDGTEDTEERRHAADVARVFTKRAAADGTVTWAMVLREEFLEALAETDPARLRAELIQIANVAVRWAEDIDRGEQRGHHAPPDPDAGPYHPRDDQGAAEAYDFMTSRGATPKTAQEEWNATVAALPFPCRATGWCPERFATVEERRQHESEAPHLALQRGTREALGTPADTSQRIEMSATTGKAEPPRHQFVPGTLSQDACQAPDPYGIQDRCLLGPDAAVHQEQ